MDREGLTSNFFQCCGDFSGKLRATIQDYLHGEAGSSPDMV